MTSSSMSRFAGNGSARPFIQPTSHCHEDMEPMSGDQIRSSESPKDDSNFASAPDGSDAAAKKKGRGRGRGSSSGGAYGYPWTSSPPSAGSVIRATP